MVHPDDAQRVSDVWAEALRSEGPVEVEYRLRRAADGLYRWFLARGKAVISRRRFKTGPTPVARKVCSPRSWASRC